MSLYGNFTLKEWLALHCATKDVDDLFRKALKDNDEPMTVLALAELAKRGDADIIMRALSNATNAGHIAPESHFAIVLTNTLANLGNRYLLLGAIAKTVHKNGWPKTSAELIDLEYCSGPEQIAKFAKYLADTSSKV